MRGFKRLALVALVVWGLAVLVRAGMAGSFGLRMQLHDAQRVQTLLATTRGDCRILVVGSSPALYGLSAGALAQATRCAAANVSMIDIGARFDDYLERVLESVRPGDIVVLTDRRWTQDFEPEGACPLAWRGGCLLSGLKFAPYVLERLRLFVPDVVPRDAAGDLVTHPGMSTRLVVMGPTPPNRLADRVALVVQQVQAVRARGACPVLASPPMLVDFEAVAPLSAAYAALGAQIAARQAGANWLPPPLETSPSLFALEGQHASAAGRAKWSDTVARAIASPCPRGGLAAG